MIKFKVFIFFLFSICLFSATEIVEVTRPWNGYWWPMNEGALVTGDGYNKMPTVMQKYDNAFTLDGKAEKFEFNNRYNPEWPYWYGHCNGWAAASILEPEPKKTVNYKGITFNVGDLKGLLTSYYQGATGETFGTRYNGEDDDFSDINPLDFFERLEEYLKEKQIPILVDTDPGEEIWTYPAYKYELSFVNEGNIRHMTMVLYFATDFVNNPDDITVDTKRFEKTYTFDIEYDNNSEPIYGENTKWTGNSINDHPDFMWYPDVIVDDPARKNINIKIENIHKIIDSNYNTTTDDMFEPNNDLDNSVYINNDLLGRSLNDDWFFFYSEPFEDLKITISVNDKFFLSNIFNIEKEKIANFGEKQNDSIDLSFDSFSKYYLQIDYLNDNSYRDNFYLNIEPTTYTSVIPHTIPNGFWINEILIGEDFTEDDSVDNSSFMVGVKNELSYQLINSLYQSKINCYRKVDFNDENFPQWVKFNSKIKPVNAYSFYLSQGEKSLGLLKNQTPKENFVLSHIPNEVEYWWYGIIFLNPSKFQKSNVEYKIYDKSGNILESSSFTLNEYEKKVGLFEEFFPGVSMSNASHIVFNCSKPIISSSLYGTLNHKELSYVPVSDEIKSGESFFVPTNVFESNNQWEGLVLVNPTDSMTNLKINFVYNSASKNFYTNLSLNPFSKWVGVIDELLPEGKDLQGLIRLEIEVFNSSLTGMALTGDHELGILSSIPFLKEYDNFDFSLPFLNIDLLKTKLFLYNQVSLNKEVEITCFDKDGLEITKFYEYVQAYDNKKIDFTKNLSESEIESISLLRLKGSRFMLPYVEYSDESKSYFEYIFPNIAY